MASSLITGAVSLLLILIAGYVIATGILTIAETTIYTQTDVTYNQELIKQTQISMNAFWDVNNSRISMYIFNNGSTSFSENDFKHMDIFTYDTFQVRNFTKADSDCETFEVLEASDVINKGMWDPSEILLVNITVTQAPKWVKFVTSNGVTTSMNIGP